MDIVARLRQGHRIDDGNPSIGRPPGYAMLPIMDEAADTIEFLRTEITRLGESLDKCHAKLMQANCPVVDVRNSKESE